MVTKTTRLTLVLFGVGLEPGFELWLTWITVGVGVGMGRLPHSTSWPEKERWGGVPQEAWVLEWQHMAPTVCGHTCPAESRQPALLTVTAADRYSAIAQFRLLRRKKPQKSVFNLKTTSPNWQVVR